MQTRSERDSNMTDIDDGYWSRSADEELRRLKASAGGLASDEAARRLAVHGPNRLRPRRKDDWFSLLLAQFKSPITLILIGAASLSLFLRDPVDAAIRHARPRSIIVALAAAPGEFWIGGAWLLQSNHSFARAGQVSNCVF